MFPTSLVLSALAFSAVMADSVAVNYPHVPLMFWSKQPTLNKQQTYVNAVVNEQDTLTVLHSVLTRDTSKDPYNVLSHDAKKEPTAEALCVFVYENLQSAQLSELSANAYVQKAIQTATSSVVIAHTTRSDSLNKELETIEHTPLAIDDVAEWVQSAEGKKLLTNGKPDLLVVHIPDDTTKDISKKMKTMDAKIEAAATALLASKQPIDFALTGNAATPVVVKDIFARRSRRLAQNTTTTASIICDVDYHIGMAKNGKAFCFTHYVHITPEILTALLFGFFFLFLAYVGISVLHGIQTPQRYPLHGPPKGKEF